LDEAPDDKGTEGPGDILSVQQVGFESSEQDVAVDPLVGEGLQDFVLVGSQRFGAVRLGLVHELRRKTGARRAQLFIRWVGWRRGTGLLG